MGEKLRIVEYDIKFLTSTRGILKNIVLILYTSDGRKINMYNIPLEIALELEKYSSNRETITSEEDLDYRYTIFDILMEMPSIEEIIKESIKEIYINGYDPENNAYYAEVVVNKNYTGYSKKLKVIPSHALLLSIMGNIPLYIDSDLLTESTEDLDDIEDLEDLDIDDIYDEDDDDFLIP